MTRILTIFIAFCCSLSFAGYSSGQETFPTKAVQIVVSFAPGGSLDVINRFLSERYKEYTGQPFVVVNKPGANGAVAMQSVLSQKPDGYNVYACAGEGMAYLHLMNPTITTPFLTDFVCIGAYGSYPLVFLVNKDLPVKNLRELADYAKKNPKALSYGTTGYGSGGHFIFEYYKQLTGIPEASLPAVHYAGVAPEITAMLGNQIQVAIMPLSAIPAKQMEAGTINALAISAAKRSPFKKEIPTVIEVGFPDLNAKDYLTYWVPAKTTPAAVKKLEELTKRVTEDKEARTKIEEMYHEVEYLNGPEARKQFEARLNQFTPLIKKLNIKLSQ